VKLAVACWFRGSPERAEEHIERAARLVEDRPTSPEKARVLATLARLRTVAGEAVEGRRIGQEALALAERLGLHDLRADTLVTVGSARWLAGDPDGAGDLEAAIELAFKLGALTAAQRGLNNLAMVAGQKGDYDRRLKLLEDSKQLAEQLGDVLGSRYVEAQLINGLFMFGEWDEALSRAERFIHACETGSPHVQHLGVLTVRGRIRFARDDEVGAMRDSDQALELARGLESLEEIATTLAWCTRLYARAGLIARGQEFADELLSYEPDTVADDGIELAWVANLLDRVEPMKRKLAAARSAQRHSVFREVAARILDGDLVAAAELSRTRESAEPSADTHRVAGERLIAEGRYEEARDLLEVALRFYRSVRATHDIREAEALLAGIPSESGAAAARPRA
jgi:tetratricopeptide (TPR) repeat protein